MKLTKSQLKEIIKEELLNEANDGELVDPFWDFNGALDKFITIVFKDKKFSKDKKLDKIIQANRKAMNVLYKHLKNNEYMG